MQTSYSMSLLMEGGISICRRDARHVTLPLPLLPAALTLLLLSASLALAPPFGAVAPPRSCLPLPLDPAKAIHTVFSQNITSSLVLPLLVHESVAD